MDWFGILTFVGARDLDGLAAALAGLTDAERKPLAAAFTAFDREWRRTGLLTEELRPVLGDMRQPDWSGLLRGLTMTGAGLLAEPALASFLARPGVGMGRFGEEGEGLPRLAAVVRARSLKQPQKLVDRLVARTDLRFDPRHGLADELVRTLPADPPLTDNFALRWLADREDLIVADIGDNPAWRRLVPRVFEAVGAGRLLDAQPGMRSAVVAVLPRADVLDGCLGAMQRGGRPGDVRGFLTWHEEIAPTPAEVDSRAAQYVSLLAGSSESTVAGMALRRVRAVDRLPVTLAAGRAALARTEKGLVRDALGWLASVAADRPQARAEVLDVLADGLTHPAPDVQDRTMKLLGRFDLGDPLRARLVALADGLPADLRAGALELAGVLEPAGALEPAGTGDEPVQPAVVGPVIEEPLPPPIGSAEELAERVLQYYALPFESAVDPDEVELILDAVVRLGWADRAGLRSVLAAALHRRGWLQPEVEEHQAYGSHCRVDDALAMVLRSVLGWEPAAADVREAEDLVRRTTFEPPWHVDPLDTVLARRLVEIAARLRYAPAPCLLATPTAADGSVDAGAFLDRLARIRAAGREPSPHDLAQALLRVPARERGNLLARLPAGEPQADAALRWLVAGPPAPVATRWRPRVSAPDGQEGRRWVLVALDGPATAGPLPSPWAALWQLPRTGQLPAWPSRWATMWPAMLPGDRDAVAAHLLGGLTVRVGTGRGTGPSLLRLVRSTGEVGPATRIALAYGAGANDVTDRAAAVDALLVLVARDELDGAAFGAELGALVAGRVLSMNRIRDVLTDVARAGGHRPVWLTLAAALPACLPADGDKPLPGVADLLALAVETALVVRPGGGVPGLDAVADRPGSSRIRTEARRLRDALAG